MGKRPLVTVDPEVCERGEEMECPDYFPEVNEFLRRMDIILKPLLEELGWKVKKDKGIENE
jgi:hypothetical protein